MRTKPCWSDCFPLPILWPLIVTILVLGFLLVTECQPKTAQAGQWYLEGGVGAAFFHPTVDDGTWRQDGVQRPNFRLLDQAWTVGIGYRITERWSVQGHRFDWGSSAVKSRFASDADYYGGHCPACPTAHSKVMDRMTGYDVTITRHFPLTSEWEPYLKAGAAVAFHELKWTYPDSAEFGPSRFNGAIPMLVIGGGLCFQRLCWDNSFYTGTLSMNGGCLNGGQYDCGYPLAKQVGVSLITFRIPLS